MRLGSQHGGTTSPRFWGWVVLVLAGSLLSGVKTTPGSLWGPQMLRLEGRLLETSGAEIEKRTDHYAGLLDSLCAAAGDSLNTSSGLCRLVHSAFKERIVPTRSLDLLSGDLEDNRFDCTSLSVILYDLCILQDTEPLPHPVQTPVHAFLSDGVTFFDPTTGTCEKAVPLPPLSFRPKSPEQMAKRPLAAALWRLGELHDRREFLVRADSLLYDMIYREEGCDPMTHAVYAGFLDDRHRLSEQEEVLRLFRKRYPDSALPLYLTGSMLLRQNPSDSAGRLALKKSLSLLHPSERGWLGTLIDQRLRDR